uniref:AlNc14C192G8481 protein n=1 Tax=Albugo laibachii Nc14 TaxID=890382 RepID=F0WQ01_9STRA|nr:AlNc14C192G8481 [Albugo laibachii Nc14]|eukprot:CCA23404.1 AlNc14C192G8481 [Albugo laibachii Nc14]
MEEEGSVVVFDAANVLLAGTKANVSVADPKEKVLVGTCCASSTEKMEEEGSVENVLVGACCASLTEKVEEKGSVVAFGKMRNGPVVALDDAASMNEENNVLAFAADALLNEYSLTPPPTMDPCGKFYNKFVDFGNTLACLFVIESDDLLVQTNSSN